MVKRQDTASLLNGYLKELLLSAMRERYAELAVQARQESLSYEQYLLELAEQGINQLLAKQQAALQVARNPDVSTAA